jgi:hypothetical protein
MHFARFISTDVFCIVRLLSIFVSRFRYWLFLAGDLDDEEYSLLGCTVVDAHRRFGESYWLQFHNRRVNQATCLYLAGYLLDLSFDLQDSVGRWEFSWSGRGLTEVLSLEGLKISQDTSVRTVSAEIRTVHLQNRCPQSYPFLQDTVMNLEFHKRSVKASLFGRLMKDYVPWSYIE